MHSKFGNICGNVYVALGITCPQQQLKICISLCIDELQVCLLDNSCGANKHVIDYTVDE